MSKAFKVCSQALTEPNTTAMSSMQIDLAPYSLMVEKYLENGDPLILKDVMGRWAFLIENAARFRNVLEIAGGTPNSQIKSALSKMGEE
jgi:hypothetical protein